MQDDLKDRVGCGEFEEQLFELLEATLPAALGQRLRAHAAVCDVCGPMLTQVEAGKAWLKQLQAIEPPANLVHNILARTSQAPVQAAAAASAPGRMERLGAWLRPRVIGMMQPRFAMTAAMSFFSISMLLNVGGVNLKDLRRLDLRPRAITTQASLSYYEMQAKVTRYYDNIKLVYEVQSSFSQMKNTAPGKAEPEKQDKDQAKPNDSTTKNKKQRPAEQDENYSLAPAVTEMAASVGNMLGNNVTSNLEEVAQ